MRVGLKLALLLTAFSLLAGCAQIKTLRSQLGSQLRSQSKQGVGQELPGVTPAQNPIDVEIAQSFVKDGKLHLKVMIRPRTTIETGQVLVSVLGLDEGQVIEEQRQVLSEAVTTKHLAANELAALFFTLTREGITEYQVKCQWGKDAQEVLSKDAVALMEKSEDLADGGAQAAPKLQDIKIASHEIPCPTMPCDVQYSVSGYLTNEQAVPFQNIALAVGLFWLEDGSSQAFPKDGEKLLENEELVSLTKLFLKPGEKKQIRLSIDQQVPVVEGGRFVPHLRIVSFQK